jgi:serine/threonine protein kinase
VVHRSAFDHDRPFEREFDGIQKFEPISHSQGQVHILHVGRNDAGGYFYYVMELADQAEPGPNCSVAAEVTRLTSSIPQHGSQGLLTSAATYEPRTLKRELQQRGRLPFEECVQISLALTNALAHLHKNGLVHRDVKPSNIIFVTGVPKLADIGLVTSVDATRSFVGTEGYLPPEGPGTPQADLYSLGKVLYEIDTASVVVNSPRYRMTSRPLRIVSTSANSTR